MVLVSVLFGNFTPIAELDHSRVVGTVAIRTIVSNSRKTSKQSVSAHINVGDSLV